MATTYTWGFSNTNALDINIDPTDIGIKTNYAIMQDNAGKVLYDNRTAPVDLGEQIKITYDPVNQVNSLCEIANPGKIKKGYQVKVRADAVKRATFDNGDIIDSPVSVELSIRGLRDGVTSDSDIATMFLRLMGACYDKTNSRWRFGDFIRNGIQASAD
jgi:hypothetical protein